MTELYSALVVAADHVMLLKTFVVDLIKISRPRFRTILTEHPTFLWKNMGFNVTMERGASGLYDQQEELINSLMTRDGVPT